MMEKDRPHRVLCDPHPPLMDQYPEGGVANTPEAIGDYLYEIFVAHHADHYAWSKVLWDITAIAWLIQAQWVPSYVTPSPLLTREGTWSFNPWRHFIRVAHDAHRDAIFRDLFRHLETIG